MFKRLIATMLCICLLPAALVWAAEPKIVQAAIAEEEPGNAVSGDAQRLNQSPHSLSDFVNGYAQASNAGLSKIAVGAGEANATSDSQSDVLLVEFNSNIDNMGSTRNNMQRAIAAALDAHTSGGKETITTIRLTGSVKEITNYNWKTLISKYSKWEGWNELTELDLSGMTNLEAIRIDSDGYYGEAIKLKTLTLPAQLTEIGDHTFKYCHNLTLQELPAGVTKIGIKAFMDCESLALKGLPAGVTEIGTEAFTNCQSLALKELPAGVTEIGAWAFYSCTNLALKELPAGVTKIGALTFYSCTNLPLQELPAGLTEIGTEAFGDCKSLVLQALPAGVTEIGDGAFNGCQSLALKELPTGITKIGSDVFNGCEGLALQALPAGLTEIGSRAFRGCRSLTRIIMEPMKAPMLQPDTFDQTSADLTFLVPKNGERYESGEWRDLRKEEYSPVTEILLQPALTLNLQDIKSHTLTAEVTPTDATFKDIIWESSDTDIATVDKDGKVTAVSTGTATITATSRRGGKTAACIVTVKTAITDATLKSLSLSSGTLSPAFAPAVTSYSAVVDYDVSSITIAATANSDQARVSGAGEKSLTVGPNPFTVTVTAEDGKTKEEYSIVVTVKSPSTDATLKSLSLSGGTLSPAFDPAVTSYSAVVDYGVSSVAIAATANSGQARVSGAGEKSLTVGPNSFTVTVTAEDGKTTEEYTIVVTVKPAITDATLKSLSLSGGTLSPAFDPAVTSYSAVVDYGVSSVAISATANSGQARVSGAGEKSLTVGPNPFTVTVTAEDGKTTEEYTIIITVKEMPPITILVTSVTLDKSAHSLYVNQTVTLTAAVQPDKATDKLVSWTSSNHHVATVDATGQVTAHAPGTATITVITNDGGKKAACDITVKTALPSGGSSHSTYKLRSSYTIAGDNIHQTISRYDLNKLADGGKSLTLRCDKAAMTFDPAALKVILAAVSQTAGNITFNAAPVDLSAFPDTAALIGARPAYDFSISCKDGRGRTVAVPVNFPTDSASISLNYAPGAMEVKERLCMVYIDGKGAVTWLDKSSYDNGKVLADAAHFSTYGVACKAPSIVFTDVADHWAKADIEFAVDRGLLSGTGNNRFSPDSTMTRGMFVITLGRLAGIAPESYQTRSFADVTEDAYYAAYVEWAVQKNMVKGIGGGLFSPDAPVTREQMAVMMTNYAKSMGYSIPAPLAAVTPADGDQISPWAAKEVALMQRAGILKGKEGNRFDPQAGATRAEVPAALRRFVEIVVEPSTASGAA